MHYMTGNYALDLHPADIFVDDRWQGRGIGTQLLALLIAGAKARGLQSMEGEVLTANAAVLALARPHGFRVTRSADDARMVRVSPAL